MRYVLCLILLCLFVPAYFTGCESAPPEPPAPVFSQKADFMLVAVFDVSGSCAETQEKKGYPLLLATIDKLFADRVGRNDRLVLARVSGSTRSILWDGKPLALRESFASGEDFRAFLEKGGGGGSRVNDSVTDAVEYVMGFPGVVQDHTCVMVLSDMLDNFPDSEQSRKKMIQTLGAYAKKGGSAAFFFTAQEETAKLRQDLATCGFRFPPVVEDEAAVSPALPQFSSE